MLGSLKLPLIFGNYYEVAGGPYVRRPRIMVGVKLAPEIKRPFDIEIPIKDFSIPKPEDLDAGLLLAVKKILQGDPVYAGCMGGKGRTGLFLAVLAKSFGVSSPVEYVRKNYYSHAVETTEQYQFVTRYIVPPEVLWEINKAKFFSLFRFSFGKCLTDS